jgi:hypothetical protein
MITQNVLRVKPRLGGTGLVVFASVSPTSCGCCFTTSRSSSLSSSTSKVHANNRLAQVRRHGLCIRHSATIREPALFDREHDESRHRQAGARDRRLLRPAVSFST